MWLVRFLLVVALARPAGASLIQLGDGTGTGDGTGAGDGFGSSPQDVWVHEMEELGSRGSWVDLDNKIKAENSKADEAIADFRSAFPEINKRTVAPRALSKPANAIEAKQTKDAHKTQASGKGGDGKGAQATGAGPSSLVEIDDRVAALMESPAQRTAALEKQSKRDLAATQDTINTFNRQAEFMKEELARPGTTIAGALARVRQRLGTSLLEGKAAARDIEPDTYMGFPLDRAAMEKQLGGAADADSDGEKLSLADTKAHVEHAANSLNDEFKAISDAAKRHDWSSAAVASAAPGLAGRAREEEQAEQTVAHAEERERAGEPDSAPESLVEAPDTVMEQVKKTHAQISKDLARDLQRIQAAEASVRGPRSPSALELGARAAFPGSEADEVDKALDEAGTKGCGDADCPESKDEEDVDKALDEAGTKGCGDADCPESKDEEDVDNTEKTLESQSDCELAGNCPDKSEGVTEAEQDAAQVDAAEEEAEEEAEQHEETDDESGDSYLEQNNAREAEEDAAEKRAALELAAEQEAARQEAAQDEPAFIEATSTNRPHKSHSHTSHKSHSHHSPSRSQSARTKSAHSSQSAHTSGHVEKAGPKFESEDEKAERRRASDDSEDGVAAALKAADQDNGESTAAAEDEKRMEDDLVAEAKKEGHKVDPKEAHKVATAIEDMKGDPNADPFGYKEEAREKEREKEMDDADDAEEVKENEAEESDGSEDIDLDPMAKKDAEYDLVHHGDLLGDESLLQEEPLPVGQPWHKPTAPLQGLKELDAARRSLRRFSEHVGDDFAVPDLAAPELQEASRSGSDVLESLRSDLRRES